MNRVPVPSAAGLDPEAPAETPVVAPGAFAPGDRVAARGRAPVARRRVRG